MTTPAKRPCASCGQNRQAKFYTSAKARICATCKKKRTRETARRGHVLRTYGLTADDHASLLEHQDGTCATCDGVRPYNFAVDHDHKTGLVRGLLCKRCNKALRDVGDDPELLRRLAAYLYLPPARAIGITALHADHRKDSTP